MVVASSRDGRVIAADVRGRSGRAAPRPAGAAGLAGTAVGRPDDGRQPRWPLGGGVELVDRPGDTDLRRGDRPARGPVAGRYLRPDGVQSRRPLPHRGFARSSRARSCRSAPGMRSRRSGAGSVGAFSGDGRLLAVAGRDGAIRLVVPDSGRELARLEPADPDRAVLDGLRARQLAAGRRLRVAKHIKVWDLGRIRRQLADLGLDWDAPPLPVEEGPERPVSIRVVGAAADPPGGRARWRTCVSCGTALLRDPKDAEAHYRLGRAFARGRLGACPAGVRPRRGASARPSPRATSSAA